jgi:ABC-type antimicrobial peptide transport system permease subunit
MYFRVDGADPLVLVETIRSTLASVHPELSPLDPGTFASHMQAAFFVQSVGSSMLSIFGTIAALITAAGVGGLAAQSVAERRKEMAIAIALGAGPRAVAWTIFAPMLKLTGLGVMAGLIIARAAAGLIRSQLPGVNGMDGWVLASTTALVMVIAIASCAGPLWRAIHTDPISTMRT